MQLKHFISFVDDQISIFRLPLTHTTTYAHVRGAKKKIVAQVKKRLPIPQLCRALFLFRLRSCNDADASFFSFSSVYFIFVFFFFKFSFSFIPCLLSTLNYIIKRWFNFAHTHQIGYKHIFAHSCRRVSELEWVIEKSSKAIGRGRASEEYEEKNSPWKRFTLSISHTLFLLVCITFSFCMSFIGFCFKYLVSFICFRILFYSFSLFLFE